MLLLTLPAACGVKVESSRPADEGRVAAPAPAAATPMPPLEPVEPAQPAFRVVAPEGNSPEFVQSVRETPGVAGVAQVSLTGISTEAGGGAAHISVAAVKPLDYRPLSPVKTAQADFVWYALMRGEIVLAHEEQAQLGIPLGARIPLRGPAGEVRFRVGGLAANGVPNLAGALMSLDRAQQLGVGDPNFLLVGVRPGEPMEPVREALAGLPGAQVEVVGGLTGKAVITGRAASRAFGSFSYVPNPDGTISPDPKWVRKNVVTRRVPILGSVVCHRLMIPQLEGAMRELEGAGLASLINVRDYHHQGGCYVPRFIGRDPGRPLSLHAWGLAIDINVDTNPPGARPRQDPRLVETMERWGFRWGGRWSPPDGHHFELAALLKA